jgi:hypothetical protein
LLALTAVTAIVLSACAKTSAGSNAQPLQIYAAGPTVADVSAALGGGDWWPGPPSFKVQPLDSAMTSPSERFSITQRFANVGTSETLHIRYTVFDSTSSATTRMKDLVTALGTTATTPKVGDQVLYYGSQPTGGAPFGGDVFVRLGQIMITISVTNKSQQPPLSLLGKLAGRLVSRLKDALNGKVRVRPLSPADSALLPPPGPDITLLGSVRLPVEAMAEMLNIASPTDFVGVFHSVGLTDFVFGDYALDKDLHMEVRAAEFNFATTADAASWIDSMVGKANLDKNGVFSTYNANTGEYWTFFTVNTRGAILVCRSTTDTEAASRACETPFDRVGGAWLQSLGIA